MTRKQKGFTLIELLIVVAIIGILAAIAIPNLLTAMQRSRQKRSMADIRSIASALEAYATDYNKYPIAGQTSDLGTTTQIIVWPNPTEAVGGLETPLQPTYIKRVPRYDGWGTEMMYGSDAVGRSYSVKSLGADKSDNSSATTSSAGPITTGKFDCDIIFSDGVFVMYPEGVQTQ